MESKFRISKLQKVSWSFCSNLLFILMIAEIVEILKIHILVNGSFWNFQFDKLSNIENFLIFEILRKFIESKFRILKLQKLSWSFFFKFFIYFYVCSNF